MDDTLKQEVDALRADLKQLRDDLLGLTKTIGQLTAQEAADGLDGIKLAGAQVQERLRQATGEAKTTIEQQLAERPLGTLLLAFGIGLLVGKAVSRG